jgi:hypothetical protein
MWLAFGLTIAFGIGVRGFARPPLARLMPHTNKRARKCACSLSAAWLCVYAACFSCRSSRDALLQVQDVFRKGITVFEVALA